ASHGRANPTGIPYLYLGSMPDTAISEIRPHTGEIATVAEFEIPEELIIVDLREPRKHVSPFVLSDAQEIGKMRADIPFLEKLGEELTRPVLPRSAAIDYIPSQYLCEFIKKIGFHGVIYRSSVSEGINLALFDPTLATPISISQYDVSRVSVEVQAKQL
ncbi:TPA: RES family NAD+ phosphorylase, partial [Klebsiella pneumoniae]